MRKNSFTLNSLSIFLFYLLNNWWLKSKIEHVIWIKYHLTISHHVVSKISKIQIFIDVSYVLLHERKWKNIMKKLEFIKFLQNLIEWQKTGKLDSCTNLNFISNVKPYQTNIKIKISSSYSRCIFYTL